VPSESFLNEKRVALTPSAAATLIKKGFSVNVQSGAGVGSKMLDSDYAGQGVKIVDKNKAFQVDILP